MNRSLDPTAEKALAINVDGGLYGTFAEIGAGQEVARWFFAVGGAADLFARRPPGPDLQRRPVVAGTRRAGGGGADRAAPGLRVHLRAVSGR